MTDVRPINTTIVGRDLEVVVDCVSEQVIIAAAVAGWDEGVADKLLRIFGPDHFLSQEHAVIWGVFREMRMRKLAWDPATARSISGGMFDENLVSLVAQVAGASPEVPENLEYHVAQMLWDRTKATAMNGPIAALIEAMKDPKSEPERIHAISRQVTASFKSGERKHLLDPKQLVHSQIAQIRARGDQSRRYVFGIDGLDFFESHEAAKLAGISDPASIAGPDGKVRKMLPGAEPGYITLISTQSGGGKTTLATALTLALAKKRRRVLYCAWEPKAGITLESLAVQVLGWSRTRVLQGQLTEQEIIILESKMSQIAQYVRFMTKEPFYDFGGSKKKRSNEQNLDIFAGYVSDSGCDVVVADLWKYCLVSQKPDEEEEALKYQQAMCEDLRFHLFLLQQQTHKRFDMRSDKRPSREGVKGSGTYLEIVDNFLAPNIPSLWKPGIPPDRFEVFVLKQRYGRWPIGVEFKWDPDSGAISDGTTIPYDFDMKDREPSTERTTTNFRRPKGAKQDVKRMKDGDDGDLPASSPPPPPPPAQQRRKISGPKIDPQGGEA